MTRAHLALISALVFGACAVSSLGCSGGGSRGSTAPAVTSGAPAPSPGASPAVKLAWDPPTTNTSGGPIDPPLASYRLYYGPDPRNYSDTIDIPDAAAREFATDAVPPGLWYFALTAIDGAGRESEFSNEVSKVVR